MSRKMSGTVVTRCVECDSRVYFRSMPDLGQVVTCRECGTRLEVIDLNPLKLDWIDFVVLDKYEDQYEDSYVDQYDDYGF